MDQLYAALMAEPDQLIRGLLRVVHFAALALGLGAATVLDIMALRYFLLRKMTAQSHEIFIFLSRFVTIGILLLWITGFAFLIFYAFTDPIKLTNEKVWAKMAIVSILSINGWFIHQSVLPFLKGQIGKTMFEGTDTAQQFTYVSMAIVSFVSWYAPVVIANLPQLNFNVPMLEILTAYGVVLAVVMFVAHMLLHNTALVLSRVNANKSLLGVE
ncbi:MAG: hypothetical protein ACSHW1_15695, partial [Yoonia sp.]|uniref:hypothetical protein n=1 Tax=Yoonia sp. TaxID=2212373 RepID=UPI003EF97666